MPTTNVLDAFHLFGDGPGGGEPDPTPAALISTYSLDGGLVIDQTSGVDGTVVGAYTATDLASMVAGVAGESIYNIGGSAHITLPANNPAHDLIDGMSISWYYQRSNNTNKHNILSWGDGSQVGDGSVEVLEDGRLRGWHVGPEPALRQFGSGAGDGIDGTNLLIDTAYRITITFGAVGAKLYLNDTLVATILENTNGWNNTRIKFLGIWSDGITNSIQGALDHLRIWDGQLTDTEIIDLEDAVSIITPEDPSEESPSITPDLSAPLFGTAANGTVDTLSDLYGATATGAVDTNAELFSGAA